MFMISCLTISTGLHYRQSYSFTKENGGRGVNAPCVV